MEIFTRQIPLKIQQADIRLFQLFIMGSLLSVGAFYIDFSIKIEQVLLTLLSGLLTQFLFIKIYQLKDVGYFSVLITCMGLSLLLRSSYLWVHPLICFLAISTKFLLRYKGKHVFNPAMFGVIVGVNGLPATWISPGQWGHELAIVFWLLAAGLFVTSRAKTHIITISFLSFYMGLLAIRVLYMGYQFPVWLHQLENGSLILFAFFMITDPKTSPDHPTARIIHTFIVALIAFIWQYYFYWNSNLIYALFLSFPLVPLLDKFFVHEKFEWSTVIR
jgi:enediyne biosynthesis protein E5